MRQLKDIAIEVFKPLEQAADGLGPVLAPDQRAGTGERDIPTPISATTTLAVRSETPASSSTGGRAAGSAPAPFPRPRPVRPVCAAGHSHSAGGSAASCGDAPAQRVAPPLLPSTPDSTLPSLRLASSSTYSASGACHTGCDTPRWPPSPRGCTRARPANRPVRATGQSRCRSCAPPGAWAARRNAHRPRWRPCARRGSHSACRALAEEPPDGCRAPQTVLVIELW